jgi:hypothetical protein
MDDGSCIYAPLAGCTDAAAVNYNAQAQVEDGSCIYAGCTDPAANNYNPAASIDNGTCTYDPIPGCIDAAACNYNALATVDDGTCDYSCYGCTYPTATNYNPAATIDDGSCTYNPCGPDTYWDVNTQQCLPADPSCPADITGNGFIDTADLLALLALFGTLCP